MAQSGQFQIVQEVGEEPNIEEVQDRMLDAADTEVDGKPITDLFPIEDRVAIVRVEVSKIVPTARGPLRHRVGVATRVTPATRATGLTERIERGQRTPRLERLRTARRAGELLGEDVPGLADRDVRRALTAPDR